MELTNSQRIAAALERSIDALTRIADSVDLNAYQQGYHDGVRDEAPDMSAALEAEYQRGRADERADAKRFLQRILDTPAHETALDAYDQLGQANRKLAKLDAYRRGEALSDAVAWIERGDHLGGTQ